MFIFSLKILLLNLYSLILNEQLIINPVPSKNLSNIVNYTYIFEFIEEGNINNQDTSVIQNLNKIYYESYIFGLNFFICTAQSNNTFLLLDKKYYSMKTKMKKIILFLT